jgi:hypothetical protein
MKAAKPQPPTGAPDGTVWFGGPIDWFRISLRITSEDLVPEEITAILGRAPDEAQQKNEPLYREDGSLLRVPTFGAWRAVLTPEDTDEWDCGEAMLELLATLPPDVQIWRALAEKYNVSLVVGLSMAAANKGFVLSPEVMHYLGERRMVAGFDVYYDPEKKG